MAVAIREHLLALQVAQEPERGAPFFVVEAGPHEDWSMWMPDSPSMADRLRAAYERLSSEYRRQPGTTDRSGGVPPDAVPA
jgi:hypothetical protein